MRILSAEFTKGARSLAECPDGNLPEIALIGRSNVGKSSLVNLLTRRKDLARVSATPGKTREINFFRINHAWHLVDLPGYGFARGLRDNPLALSQLAGSYLAGRETLRLVLALIDSRHPPQAIDLDFCEWLHTTGKPFVLVFTKSDKQSPARTGANIALFQEAVHPRLGFATLPEALPCSSTHRSGHDLVLSAISRALGE
jgi:GTP-binding protein